MLPLLALMAASVSPESLYRLAVNNPALEKNGYGESFCWNGAFYMRSFLTAYQAFGDTAWLDQGVRYYEYLLSKMQTGPDGYRGWIGPYMYDNSVWCDVHVGDALLLDGMAGFAEAVLKDPALSRRYGETARRYIALARREFFEKWDTRGTWNEDGPYGAYRSWNRYGDPGQTANWTVRDPVRGSNLTLPFNKQEHVGALALKLFRITGEEAFRRRAQKIFAWHKSRMQLLDGRYFWNYWEPFGPWDLDTAAGKTRHWVGVHPDRAYQAGEVGHIVDAYHTGVVFDAEDIRRILNTNLKVMWNGDRENPRYRNSNGKEQQAGALWASLAEFDQTVRDLRAAQLARGRGDLNDIARAYFEKVTLKSPPGFARRHPGPATIFDFPFRPCAQTDFAAAIPTVIRDEAWVAGNTREPAQIEIALGDRTLHAEKRSGWVMWKWRPEVSGESKLRVGCREIPVTVTAGKAGPGR